MSEAKIEQLIINSPYSEPLSYWKYNRDYKCFDRVEGRRPAGYFRAKPNAKDENEGEFITLELVNNIRPRVKQWRESDWPGVTNTTRKLLSHWHDMSMRAYPFFFCQLDAIETLIWLSETREGQRVMIQDDGGKFRRLCTKLCTGGGKTIVMAMLTAWQVCNKVQDVRNTHYTKNILIVAPNLTVKKRLEVLRPGLSGSYYERFDVVPPEMNTRMNQARVIIQNWQALEFESPSDIAKRKSVDKRGVLCDEAYTRKILGRNMQNILVINDEAHHAWRVKPEDKANTREQKEDMKEATIWIQGLDKIHNAARILTCYDFSATPFVQGRGKNNTEKLFEWIVSDFSLSDGIESGLVKTPRVAVRDNTPDMLPKVEKSKLFHIYADETVRDNLTNSQPPEALLPDLVRNAYMLLASDWKETFDRWQSSGKKIPPVMISVANCTATAARIEKYFADERLNMPELCEPDKILRIDSSVLSSTSKELELREKADTVGQEGEPGGDLRNIISVGMLSEGWDAKTVTHIMGLRAFSSQLLCEQVVGRGLRRTSYDVNDDKLFSPEYVNIFGVPFTFLPHETPEGEGKVTDPKITDEIKVLPERSEFSITWPNLMRVEYVINQKLTLDVNAVPELELNAQSTKIIAELAPVLDGQTDLSRCSEIDINKLFSAVRAQTLEFKAADKIYDEMQNITDWQKHGVKLKLIGQVIRLVNEYLEGGRIKIYPELFITSQIRRKILIALNMEKIIKHIWSYIRSENSNEVLPVFCDDKKTRSTGEMPRWWTVKANVLTHKSHINRCVYDSKWESSEAFCLEHNSNVKAYAKNDHLGFYVSYLYNGIIRRYFPDFLIKLDGEKYLILEVKGQESEQDKIKRRALQDWCKAVNRVKDYGFWSCDVSQSPADIDGIILKYAN